MKQKIIIPTTNNRRPSTQCGSMLIDLMIALVVGSLFVAIIANNASSARSIYENAKAKLAFLKLYDDYLEQFTALLPGQALAVGTSTSMSSTLFGNDFYQNKTDFGSLASSSLGSFILIKSKHSNNVPISSQPVCSTDFSNHQALGSYAREQSQNKNIDSLKYSVRRIHLPIDPSIFPTSILVRNNIAFVSLDSNSAGDPDFMIFDLATSTEAKIISSLNTGPGLVDIAMVGKYVYGSAPSTIGQVHVMRLDSLTKPVLVGRYKLPLPFATATPALGSSIDYFDGNLYLGTEKWIGDEFNIIDITNREALQKIGGVELDSKVTDVLAVSDNVYFTASNINQFGVVNTANFTAGNFSPDNTLTPQIVFSPSGWERQEGKVISLFENNLSLGRTSGGFDMPVDHELFLFATTSTTTLTTYSSQNFAGGVYGILFDRNFIYLISRTLNKEFQIFNIQNSDNDSSVSISATSTIDISLPFQPQALTCDQNKIYILAHESPFVYEITLFK